MGLSSLRYIRSDEIPKNASYLLESLKKVNSHIKKLVILSWKYLLIAMLVRDYLTRRPSKGFFMAQQQGGWKH
ncbi:uncharacterized protein EAF02_006844 [Botrytis sinoallii]|uniref:uncharacterized protein n=1 Tax=Botrytis sinoallii TaxID=1463999 RepID=UPI0019012811|nr:uncharacterized protein EAF02_006844 [Botrytis sinoallii]KAF7880953.1 hypothetical protein EAF02_006844 [Botrytis sinoallii]